MEVDAPIEPEEAVHRLAAALDSQQASRVWTNGVSVGFSVSLFGAVGRWNILAPVDQGAFLVTGHAGALVVDYELSYRRTLALVTLMVCGFFGPFVMLVWAIPLLSKLSFLVVAWCWLFGANYVLSFVRFPEFIRRSIGTGRPSNTPLQPTSGGKIAAE